MQGFLGNVENWTTHFLFSRLTENRQICSKSNDAAKKYSQNVLPAAEIRVSTA